MKHLLYLIVVIFSFSTYAQDNPQFNQGMDKVVEGNTRFAFDLYHLLKNEKGNIFFSPYNISAAFALTVAGAKGETALEMQKVLHYPINTYPLMGELNHFLQSSYSGQTMTELNIANAVWVQKELTLLPAYQLTLTNVFQAPVERVNFTAAPVDAIKTINQWVTTHTKGKINQLLSPQDITTSTKMVLTSAIYLKAQWQQQFDPKQTTKQTFYVLNRPTIQTLMMKKTANYPLLVNQSFAMIELPYTSGMEQGPNLSMFIVLPQPTVGLDVIENQLTFENWQQWMSQFKTKKVSLTLPKFRIEDRFMLNPIMKALGMNKPFSLLADFSGMTGRKELYINEAIHKTYITVDEEGTEAAAATAMTMNLTSSGKIEIPYRFTADHPFIFFIIDKHTKSLLFVGRVMQP